jgi:hypothetical protein
MGSHGPCQSTSNPGCHRRGGGDLEVCGGVGGAGKGVWVGEGGGGGVDGAMWGVVEEGRESRDSAVGGGDGDGCVVLPLECF